MIEMTDAALEVVQRSYTMRVRAESWQADELLADDIPIAEGGEDIDRSLSVPERVTLTVPRIDRGVNWDPLTPDHPLAAYGQQLRVSIGVDVGSSGTEWLERGTFLVRNTSTDGDTVKVEAVGLLALIEEARFVAPFEPSGSFEATIRALVEPALTVVVSGELVDRTIPVGMQWDEDRLGALFEVLDAWPAVARVTEDGYLSVEPPPSGGSSVLDLTDGAGGTIVRWQGEASRDGAFNVVVARGEGADGTPVQGTAYDLTGTSPLRFSGPFSALPVPHLYYSPLLTTVAQCRAAAQTILARKRRAASRKVAATAVPHPGLVGGDLVTVTGPALTDAVASIERLTLPYTPGPMSLSLAVDLG